MPSQDEQLAAHVSTTVSAAAGEVWKALVDPAAIEEYMFGTTVTSAWTEGSPITWSGEWEGRAYEDKGVIVRLEVPRLLQYTHFTPLSGLPDEPQNYHTVTIELTPDGDGTRVSLSQDGNTTREAREHSKRNWQMMLDSLKAYVERMAREAT